MPRVNVKMLVKAKPGFLSRARDAQPNWLRDTIRLKMEGLDGTLILQVLVGTGMRQDYNRLDVSISFRSLAV